jgi:hypothetical protein
MKQALNTELEKLLPKIGQNKAKKWSNVEAHFSSLTYSLNVLDGKLGHF